MMTGIGLDILGACSCAGDGIANEDFFGWTETAAWILDGATGIFHETLPYPSDAYWFTRAFDNYLHQFLLSQPELDTTTLISRALESTKRDFEHFTGDKSIPDHKQPSAAFAMLRIIGCEVELTSVGDCKAVFLDNEGVVSTFFDPSLTPFENRTLSALRKLRANFPTLPQSQLISKLKSVIGENRKSMNKPGGYRVLSTARMDKKLIRAHRMRVTDINPIVALTTDGFLRHVEVFGLSDVASLLTRLSQGKINSIVDEVRAEEHADPECIKFIRVKKSDDATCLVVKLQRR